MKRLMIKFILGVVGGIGLYLSLLVATTFAQTVTPFPQPTGFVNDYAHVLTQNEINILNSTLSDYQKKTTNEIAVVTIDTTGDQTIEDTSIAIADQWKPGVKGKDNGVILLLAIKDHHDRIEVGRGLQGNLTDIQASGILDDMKPDLRAGDYNGAIVTGVNEIRSAIGGSGSSTDTTASSGQSSGDNGMAVGFLIFIVIVIIVISLFAIGKASGGSDDDGDDDSGSSGSGLGGFLGGLATGSVLSGGDSSDDDDDSSSSSGSSFGGFSGGGDSFGGFSGGSFDGGGASGSW